ncbi:hypothetical protein K5V21_14705 [Clostridium sardiniense]|uniref:DUF5673 domain-containing protein n=1 Tax=Clostridium sardiniense TaxID=29369 RepID=A0ABS7L1H9_CLOSR|nr:hypothetical protein [Clostridium sardiniense]MBY0756697.1 hypothetical protein [Clostridium sardiniense]MDQ0458555.1 uncharacterized membrane protein YobD (UPF0266 family) [Clostridium sardiniense]
MNYTILIEILLCIAVAFFMARSFTIERNHKKKGPFITIRVFSYIAIFNVLIVIFIIITSFTSLIKGGVTSLFDPVNLLILLLVLFVIYQVVLSLKVTFCQDGICYLGEFFSYTKIKSVQTAKNKNKFSIVIYTNRKTLTFKVSKNNKILIEETFNKYKIKVSNVA